MCRLIWIIAHKIFRRAYVADWVVRVLLLISYRHPHRRINPITIHANGIVVALEATHLSGHGWLDATVSLGVHHARELTSVRLLSHVMASELKCHLHYSPCLSFMKQLYFHVLKACLKHL